MEPTLAFELGPFRDIFKDSRLSLIAQGYVAELEFFHDTVGALFTIITLDVERIWRGPVTRQLRYMETGGFIKASDLAAINGPKDFPYQSREPTPDGWVGSVLHDGTHPKLGERYVVFLAANADPRGRYAYQQLHGPWARNTHDDQTGPWNTVPYTMTHQDRFTFPPMTVADINALM